MNQAIHSVGLLTWLMGPVVEVRAMTGFLARERIDVKDVAMATVAFANGALGTIEASTAIYPRLSQTYRNPWQRRFGHYGGGRYR